MLYLNGLKREETRWRKIRGTRSPSPTNTTKKKTHIYRINDSHRTATNRRQKNLNSNNGKKVLTLLGKTREKRRVKEGESELDGHSQKGTVEEKGILHPGNTPTWRKDQTNWRNLQMQRRV